MGQKGFTAIPLVLGIIAVLAIFGFIIYSQIAKEGGKFSNSQNTFPSPSSLLKTEYSNPFDEKSSYKNPFSQSDSYSNPFDNLSQ